MRTIILVAVLLSAACASRPLEAIVTQQKLVGWRVGSQRDLGRGKGTIVELVPAGEPVDRWQHLGTIQFMEGERRSPQLLMEDLEASMSRRCPSSTEWRVTSANPNWVEYEWRIHSCAGQDDQSEIARIFQGNDGLHRIAYTEKGDAMDSANRDFWMAALQKAYAAKGDPGHPITLNSL